MRAEISFSGISVRELSERTEISKRTLDNYLRRDNPSNPTAENAVRIARVLGVTVERLVSGEDSARAAEGDLLRIFRESESLSPAERLVVLDLIGSLKARLRRAANGGER